MRNTSVRPSVFPAIDVLDRAQAIRSAELAFAMGADGIFFNHSDDDHGLLRTVARQLRAAWPDKLVGAAYARLGPSEALRHSLDARLDATWTARRDVTSQNASADAVEAAGILKAHGGHCLFAAVASPDHPDDPHPETAAVRAQELGMIPTTFSEPEPGPYRKLKAMRRAIGDAPLALSGFAPGSLAALSTLPSHLFVSTAAESGFQYFDPDLLKTWMSRLAAAAFITPSRA